MASTPHVPSAGTADDSPPHFPPELEREVFETTAYLYPSTIPKLLRIARRVLFWIEPLLYETLSIEAQQDKRVKDYALLRSIDTKPADFFPKAVRYLHLVTMAWSFMGHRPQTPWTDTELEKVLRACQGVVRVILLGNLDEPVTLLSMLADMRPRHAYLLVDMLSPQLDLTLLFFRQVSHMLVADLNDTPESSTGGGRHNFSSLPALTHLALSLLTPRHILSGVLSDCPNLLALVLYANEEMTTKAKHFSVNDPRVVVLVSEDLLSQWNMTSGDIWARADSFISRKRRGEIEGLFPLPSTRIPALIPNPRILLSLGAGGDTDKTTGRRSYSPCVPNPPIYVSSL
ncbi:hypothetical protein DFH06DRAFT_1329140 [Mycena polygramma]|nr:hypothetical protein DFH06DRAFT_1329140 [Mycena polygramma]